MDHSAPEPALVRVVESGLVVILIIFLPGWFLTPTIQ